MFKFLFRSFIATLLSVTLITQSIAQTQTYNSDGTVTTTQSKTFVGAQNNKNWLASATMGAMAMVAVMLSKYKYTTDVLLAIGAGVAYLIGEMTTTGDVNAKTMEIVTRSAGAQNEQQLADLNKQKATIDEALKAVKLKYQFQMIAVYAFGLAAAAVAWNATALLMAERTQDTATKAMTTACSSISCPLPTVDKTLRENIALAKSRVCEKPVHSSFGLCNSACKETLYNSCVSTLQGELSAAEAALVTETEACKLAAAAAADTGNVTAPAVANSGIMSCHTAKMSKVAADKAVIAAKKAVQTFGTPVVVGGYSSPRKELKKRHNYLENFFNFIVPSASAGASTKTQALIWGAGGAAIGFGLSQTIAVTADPNLFSPLTRGLVWAAFLLIVNEAAKSTKDVIDSLESQSNDLQRIIDQMTNRNATTGSPGAGPAGGPVAPPPSIAPPPFQVSPTGGEKTFPCVIGNGNTNCTPVAGALGGNAAFANLPPDIAAAGMGFASNLDRARASSSITPDSFGNASQRAGNLSAMNNMLGKARDALNAQLTKMGKPPINFDQQGKDLARKFLGITEDTMKKAGLKPSNYYSSGGGFNNSIGSGRDGSLGNSKLGTGHAKEKGGAFAGVKPGGTSPTKIPNFNFKDEPGAAQEAAAAPTSIDQFEVSKDDINKDSGASIFLIISERYIKSGYPALLEEVPPKAAEPVPATK